VAERVTRVGAGGARSAAYGMPGRQGAARITCGPGGRSSARAWAATARFTCSLCQGERGAANQAQDNQHVVHNRSSRELPLNELQVE
jgi:hypothetical protein